VELQPDGSQNEHLTVRWWRLLSGFAALDLGIVHLPR
jgi:hypothetical protein